MTNIESSIELIGERDKRRQPITIEKDLKNDLVLEDKPRKKEDGLSDLERDINIWLQ